MAAIWKLQKLSGENMFLFLLKGFPGKLCGGATTCFACQPRTLHCWFARSNSANDHQMPLRPWLCGKVGGNLLTIWSNQTVRSCMLKAILSAHVNCCHGVLFGAFRISRSSIRLCTSNFQPLDIIGNHLTSHCIICWYHLVPVPQRAGQQRSSMVNSTQLYLKIQFISYCKI